MICRVLVMVGACDPDGPGVKRPVRRFIDGKRHNLARAALDAGCADQAHLARECAQVSAVLKIVSDYLYSSVC